MEDGYRSCILHLHSRGEEHRQCYLGALNEKQNSHAGIFADLGNELFNLFRGLRTVLLSFGKQNTNHKLQD